MGYFDGFKRGNPCTNHIGGHSRYGSSTDFEFHKEITPDYRTTATPISVFWHRKTANNAAENFVTRNPKDDAIVVIKHIDGRKCFVVYAIRTRYTFLLDKAV